MDRSGKFRAALVVCAVVGCFCTAGHAKIIYVDDDAGGDGDGSSWEDAYRYLQDALADSEAAAKPVEIRVAGGVYKPDRTSADPNGTGDRQAAFSLVDGVSLKGGFAGAGAADPNRRDVAEHQTILSGDLAGDDREVSDPCDLPAEPSRFDNSFCVVSLRETNHTSLEGLTITAAHTFSANAPPRRTFTLASSYMEGGGVSAVVADGLSITNCLFSDNCGADGSGLYLFLCYFVEIADCTFTRNEGGALYAEAGNLTLQRCHFARNRATRGAALCSDYADVAMTDCTFVGNSAEDRGGALFARCRDVTLSGCSFVGNQAKKAGGVIWNDNGDIGLLNCTSSGNRASRGCFVFATDSRPRSGQSVSVANCIAANEGNEIWNEWGTTTIWYSNIQADRVVALDPDATLVWGLGNMEADPCFVDPGYWDPNGTPDDVNDDVFIEGDYHLRSQSGRWDPASARWVKDEASSPCIDAGDPHSAHEREPGPHGKRINLGAYGNTTEASLSDSELGNPADVDNNEVVNLRDLALMGQMWLSQAVPTRADLNKDGRVDTADLPLLSAGWLWEPLELRFADYWPFVVGDVWQNANQIADGGVRIKIADRFLVNGFDVCQVELSGSSLRGGWKEILYYVYVNGGLYSTSSTTELQRLPDVTEGFSFQWPELIQTGRPICHLDKEYVPVRMTLKQLGVWFEEEHDRDILRYYLPEDYDRDILAFTDERGEIVAAFGRGFGPVIYRKGCTYYMERIDESQ
ncbi:MAG: right-handed parallel beta-helix repeat-containing protein [Sedimentisphaerales bacterium]|nr:right-handed parallel beta-helix repeat-containing protein [Sedimentisphaerales bacterium]